MLSSNRTRRSRALVDVSERGSEHHVGEVTLEAAEGFEPGLAFGDPTRDIRLSEACLVVSTSVEVGLTFTGGAKGGSGADIGAAAHRSSRNRAPLRLDAVARVKTGSRR
jgi:hypothetical protein